MCGPLTNLYAVFTAALASTSSLILLYGMNAVIGGCCNALDAANVIIGEDGAVQLNDSIVFVPAHMTARDELSNPMACRDPYGLHTRDEGELEYDVNMRWDT